MKPLKAKNLSNAHHTAITTIIINNIITSFLFWFVIFETGSPCVLQTGLDLTL